MALLEVTKLKVYYQTGRGVNQAVDGISFELDQGSSIGLVGESGCGKSTTVKGIVRVMPTNAFIPEGEVYFNGSNILKSAEKEMRQLRWRDISIVPQAAMDSLNPVYTVRNQFLEVMQLKGGLNKKQALVRAKELFALVGLNSDLLNYYPHQFSGGMKQRAVIALALALNPRLIITDEPVTALDVIVQHQILNELKELRQQLGLAMVMITHDISVVAQTCDQIAVMYAGKIVEKGKGKQVLKNPLHPYTMGLKNCFPNLNQPNKELIAIAGSPPDLIDPPSGCRFYDRCPFAMTQCQLEEPGLEELESGHLSACFLREDIDQYRNKAKEVETWLQVIM